MFEQVPKPALALSFAVATYGSAYAQAPGHASQSPDDCVADHNTLDVNGDGCVDNDEMSKYSIARTKLDTDKDGKLSAGERTIFCRSGLAKTFRPAG